MLAGFLEPSSLARTPSAASAQGASSSRADGALPATREQYGGVHGGGSTPATASRAWSQSSPSRSSTFGRPNGRKLLSPPAGASSRVGAPPKVASAPPKPKMGAGSVPIPNGTVSLRLDLLEGSGVELGMTTPARGAGASSSSRAPFMSSAPRPVSVAGAGPRSVGKAPCTVRAEVDSDDEDGSTHAAPLDPARLASARTHTGPLRIGKPTASVVEDVVEVREDGWRAKPVGSTPRTASLLPRGEGTSAASAPRSWSTPVDMASLGSGALFEALRAAADPCVHTPVAGETCAPVTSEGEHAAVELPRAREAPLAPVVPPMRNGGDMFDVLFQRTPSTPAPVPKLTLISNRVACPLGRAMGAASKGRGLAGATSAASRRRDVSGLNDDDREIDGELLTVTDGEDEEDDEDSGSSLASFLVSEAEASDRSEEADESDHAEEQEVDAWVKRCSEAAARMARPGKRSGGRRKEKGGFSRARLLGKQPRSPQPTASGAASEVEDVSGDAAGPRPPGKAESTVDAGRPRKRRLVCSDSEE